MWNARRKTVVIGGLLLASGPALNYLFERHNVLAVWLNSPYPVTLLDGIYPPLCVFLSLTGIVILIGGFSGRTSIRQLRFYVYVTAIPFTIFYTLFVLAMQAVSSGADRLGECPGLVQAASAVNVIPPSQWRPSQPAIGCGVDRRGIFLSDYNNIGIGGVKDAAAQELVIERLEKQFHEAHTHPLQVVFRDMGTWSTRRLENGATWGSGRPGRIIRIVNIG
jgi:hypothetical protein